MTIFRQLFSIGARKGFASLLAFVATLQAGHIALAQGQGDVGNGQQEGTNSGYALKLTSSKSSYEPGEKITLSVLLTNTGLGAGEVWFQHPLAAYELEVAFPSGLPCPLSEKGKARTESEREFPHLIPKPLEPGHSHTNSLELDQLFDMWFLGKYTVRVTRRVPSRFAPGKQIPITSEPLYIVITNGLPTAEKK